MGLKILTIGASSRRGGKELCSFHQKDFSVIWIRDSLLHPRGREKDRKKEGKTRFDAKDSTRVTKKIVQRQRFSMIVMASFLYLCSPSILPIVFWSFSFLTDRSLLFLLSPPSMLIFFSLLSSWLNPRKKGEAPDKSREKKMLLPLLLLQLTLPARLFAQPKGERDERSCHGKFLKMLFALFYTFALPVN